MPLDPARLVGGGLAIVALLYLGIAAGLFFWQRHIVFPGAFGRAAPRFDALPPGVEATTVGVADGTVLRALWKAPAPGGGVVLSFHGNGSFPEQGAARFAGGVWDRDGWGLLAIAYRGYPGSTGRPSEAGVIADGLAAYAEAKRRAPGSPVLIHGHSLGGAVAVAVAAREADHLGLYLEAPFASIEALARKRFPFLPVSLLLRDPFRSDTRIGVVRGRIVIVHGSADSVVPPSEGRRLADAAPAGTIFDVVGGDHVAVLGSRDAAYVAAFPRHTAILQ